MSYNYGIFDDTTMMGSTTTGVDTTIGSSGGGGGYGIYTIGTGTSGQTLTWNGTNPVWTTTPSSPLKINGDAEIEGDIKVKGKSLSEAIENIEKRLAILHPNSELEERWEQLKELGERYRELEQDILEKEKIWDTLKK